MHDLIRLHAEMYIRGLMIMAILDVGDFKAAENLARQALVELSLSLPEAKRSVLIHRLGIEARTFDDWKAQLKERLKEEDGLTLEQLEARRTFNENIRFFAAAIRTLLEVGSEYATLGRITDRINELLEPAEDYSVARVKERLEMYVGLGQLERHPQHRERYRLAVLRPTLIDDEVSFREELLEFMFPSLYRVTFQILAGAAGAGMKVSFFKVPEGQEERLIAVAQDGYRRMLKALDEEEAALAEEFKDASRHEICFIFLHGREPLAAGRHGRLQDQGAGTRRRNHPRR
jgi:hypothetical protein